MKDNYLKDCKLEQSTGVFTLKNLNTTLGFVRFNQNGEIEYIFVNPIFRKKGLAKKLLELVKNKTGKKLIFQDPQNEVLARLLMGALEAAARPREHPSNRTPGNA